MGSFAYTTPISTIYVALFGIHPVVEVTPFTSDWGNHNLHGTPRGNEVTEVTPKHTKNHWNADTDSNTYFERIKSEYHGILLWTQQRTDPHKILLHVIRSKHENGETSTSGCNDPSSLQDSIAKSNPRTGNPF